MLTVPALPILNTAKSNLSLFANDKTTGGRLNSPLEFEPTITPAEASLNLSSPLSYKTT